MDKMVLKLMVIVTILMVYQLSEAKDEQEEIYNKMVAEQNPAIAEQLFKELFKLRRGNNLEAIKTFQTLTVLVEKFTRVAPFAESVFEGIENSRAAIEASGYTPGASDFPADTETRDALGTILENTVMYSELVINCPDIAIPVLKVTHHYDLLFQWSIAFANRVEHLLDKPTVRMLENVGEMLDYTDREPDYKKPYGKIDDEPYVQIIDQSDNKMRSKLKKLRKHNEL